MKKSLLILPVLLLSLAACNEGNETNTSEVPSAPDETYTQDSTVSTYGVIDYVNSRGAAISSWTGVYSYWDTVDNCYLDGSYYGYGDELIPIEEYCDSEIDEIWARNDNGLVTGLETVEYTSYSTSIDYADYYDGSVSHVNNNGEISQSTTSRTLSYYTSDIADLIDTCIYYFTYDYMYPTESGSYYEIEANVTASLGRAESGNTQATITDIYYETGMGGDWYGYYYYEDLYEETLTIVYDSNDQIVSLEYSLSDITIYSDGEVDTIVQNITYLPYSGAIEVPSWVN